MSPRFASCPNSRHEIRIRFNYLKTTALQALRDVVRDVIAVIRLMKHTSEIFHNSTKCWAIIQLDRIG